MSEKIYRPWGWYQVGFQPETTGKIKFQTKHICVYPKKRLSLQSHFKRSEHWVMVKGTGIVQVGKDFLTLHENQHVYIPKETLHRITIQLIQISNLLKHKLVNI